MNLKQQLQYYPVGTHDDCTDVLQMTVECWQRELARWERKQRRRRIIITVVAGIVIFAVTFAILNHIFN